METDKIAVVGRVTAVIAVAGPLLMMGSVLLWPALRARSGPEMDVLDWVGFFTAWSVFITWGLAVWHWGTRYPPSESKGRWGLAVVFGFVIGAALYWFGAARARGASGAAPGGVVRERG